MKPIQTIKAWRYPCDEKVFHYEDFILEFATTYSPIRIKKVMENYKCLCGKNCKPERITITVTKR